MAMTDELIQNLLVPIAVGGISTIAFVVLIWAGLQSLEVGMMLSKKYNVDWKKVLDIVWVAFVAVMFFWLIGGTILDGIR